MQNWSEVRLGLEALGYRRILNVEIVCKSCGTWRGAIHQEADFYPCPQCSAACTLGVVVEGFSCHELPPWEKRAKGLSAKARDWIMCDHFLEDRSLAAKQRRHRAENDRYADYRYASRRNFRMAPSN